MLSVQSTELTYLVLYLFCVCYFWMKRDIFLFYQGKQICACKSSSASFERFSITFVYMTYWWLICKYFLVLIVFFSCFFFEQLLDKLQFICWSSLMKYKWLFTFVYACINRPWTFVYIEQVLLIVNKTCRSYYCYWIVNHIELRE